MKSIDDKYLYDYYHTKLTFIVGPDRLLFVKFKYGEMTR